MSCTTHQSMRSSNWPLPISPTAQVVCFKCSTSVTILPTSDTVGRCSTQISFTIGSPWQRCCGICGAISSILLRLREDSTYISKFRLLDLTLHYLVPRVRGMFARFAHENYGKIFAMLRRFIAANFRNARFLNIPAVAREVPHRNEERLPLSRNYS